MLGCTALAWLLLGAPALASDDPVVAERGRDHITASQARAVLASLDPDARHKLAAQPNGITDLLRNILIQRALLEQAQADHWEQRPDVASLLARTHDQVVSQSYLAFHAQMPAGYPTDAELQAAYDQTKAQFMQPRGYHIIQLFLPKETSAATDAQKRLAALRAQINRSHVTMEAAAKQSAGVKYLDLGWVTEAQLIPSVKSAIAGLPEGAMTDPVCTENGCHLIRLVATRPAGPAPLADIHDALVKAMRQQKQAELQRAYASSLLAKQPVAINEIELSRVTQ